MRPTHLAGGAVTMNDDKQEQRQIMWLYIISGVLCALAVLALFGG